jgi:hypothetical protein
MEANPSPPNTSSIIFAWITDGLHDVKGWYGINHIYEIKKAFLPSHQVWQDTLLFIAL